MRHALPLAEIPQAEAQPPLDLTGIIWLTEEQLVLIKIVPTELVGVPEQRQEVIVHQEPIQHIIVRHQGQEVTGLDHLLEQQHLGHQPTVTPEAALAVEEVTTPDVAVALEVVETIEVREAVALEAVVV